MDKYLKLIKNSGTFMIANFGSKIVSLLMVRLYTEMLSQEEYGTLDIMTTVIYLVVPFCTLSVQEAVLRYSMDKDKDSCKVLKNAYGIIGIGCCLIICISCVVWKFGNEIEIFLIMALIILESFYNTTMQYARGIGRVKIFAFGGVLYTIIMSCSNIVYLVYFKWGIVGYLLAMITADFIVTMFYICILKIGKVIRRTNFDKALLQEMLKYSIPMIPNALIWWLMGAADKYLLVYWWGVAANGLYAVAHKIPTILNTLGSIFFQAWQISAVDAYDDEKKSEFYGRVFHFFYSCMILTVGVINVVVKPIYSIFVSEDFYIARKYTSFLMLAMVFSAASTFVGTYYSVIKKTKGNLKTNAIGVILNIMLNCILIPRFGITGAAIATFAGYLVIWVIRTIDTNKFMKVKYHYFRIGCSAALCIAQGLILALEVPYTNIICIALLALLFYNEKEILLLFKRCIAGGIRWVKKSR